jgi:acetyl esterase/lipase
MMSGRNPVPLLAAMLATFAVATPAGADTPPSGQEVIPLYDGVAPGSEGWTQHENTLDLEDPRFKPANADTLVWNVTHPTLTVFRPAQGKSNGTAIVVAPGGGFRVLSFQNEGTRVAQWLTVRGFTAFVLKYRLRRMPDDPAEVRKGLDEMMKAAASGAAARGMPVRIVIGPEDRPGISDGQRAGEVVRSRAKEFGVSVQRVGIIGFSAGGVVAGETAIAPSKPDFVGIIYSNVPDKIPTGAPPAFMAAAADDPLSKDMPDLFVRWREAGSVAELHIYSKGHHGFGTTQQGLPVDHWMDAWYAWLAQQGFAGKPAH